MRPGLALALAAGLAATGVGAAMAEGAAPVPSAAAADGTTEKDERLARPAAFQAAVAADAAKDAVDEAAVRLRMTTATAIAVPIENLDDALITTGSVAPDGGGTPSAPGVPQSSPAAAMPAASPTAVQPMPNIEPAADETSEALPGAAAPSREGRIASSVKMRTKPDNAAEIVSVLAADSAVTVLNCDYWCEVEAAGKRGFVFRKFVKSQ